MQTRGELVLVRSAAVSTDGPYGLLDLDEVLALVADLDLDAALDAVLDLDAALDAALALAAVLSRARGDG